MIFLADLGGGAIYETFSVWGLYTEHRGIIFFDVQKRRSSICRCYSETIGTIVYDQNSTSKKSLKLYANKTVFEQ